MTKGQQCNYWLRRDTCRMIKRREVHFRTQQGLRPRSGRNAEDHKETKASTNRSSDNQFLRRVAYRRHVFAGKALDAGLRVPEMRPPEHVGRRRSGEVAATLVDSKHTTYTTTDRERRRRDANTRSSRLESK